MSESDWLSDVRRPRRPVKKLTAAELQRVMKACTFGAEKPTLISRYPLKDIDCVEVLNYPDEPAEALTRHMLQGITHLRANPTHLSYSFKAAEFDVYVVRRK